MWGWTIIFFLEVVFAQAPTYTPEHYANHSCPFAKDQIPWRDRAALEQRELEIQTRAHQMRDKYPFDFPLVQDPLFLTKLSGAIFKNEANCKTDHFTHWGRGEDFPSLGLVHAIWYPEGVKKSFQDSFPSLMVFLNAELKKNSTSTARCPEWLKAQPIGAAPWISRHEFQELNELSRKIETAADSSVLHKLRGNNSARYQKAFRLFELRHFLSHPDVIRWQGSYLVQRMKESLHRLLAAEELEPGPRGSAADAYQTLTRLLKTEEGVLSVIDYINFKGDGLRFSEVTPIARFPWGLKTVIELMPHLSLTVSVCQKKGKDYDEIRCANHQFAEAARCALHRLAKHSGPEGSPTQQQRYKWLNGGWQARIETNYFPATLQEDRCAPARAVSNEPAQTP